MQTNGAKVPGLVVTGRTAPSVKPRVTSESGFLRTNQHERGATVAQEFGGSSPLGHPRNCWYERRGLFASVFVSERSQPSRSHIGARGGLVVSREDRSRASQHFAYTFTAHVKRHPTEQLRRDDLHRDGGGADLLDTFDRVIKAGHRRPVHVGAFVVREF
jgi:hypothetical protein